MKVNLPSGAALAACEKYLNTPVASDDEHLVLCEKYRQETSKLFDTVFEMGFKKGFESGYEKGLSDGDEG